jgi:hypothetical protein
LRLRLSVRERDVRAGALLASGLLLGAVTTRALAPKRSIT